MQHAVSLEMMIERLLERLGELWAFGDELVLPLEALEFAVAGPDPIWRRLPVGAPWPERAPLVRLRYRGALPERLRGRPLHLSMDVGGEALLMVDGKAHAGLNPYHREVRLFERAEPDRELSLDIEAVPHLLFGTPVERPVLAEAAFVVPDEDVRGLAFDLQVVLDAARALDKAGRRDPALRLAELASRIFAEAPLPRSATEPYLARLVHGARNVPLGHAGSTPGAQLGRGLWERYRFRAAMAPIDDERRAALRAARKKLAAELEVLRADIPPSGRVIASGHAHIDLAWLWPIRETRRKVRRTFATVLSLMDRYPGFCFNQSSAQFYAWMEEDDPELFERIKKRVAEGRWEIVGGMWVEADGNLPFGEAWVRQLLYGQRYFEDRFGKRAKTAWFPDTFGYAANLPQLLVQGGLESFFTIKLNWSETNVFPFDLYRWEGIDGTAVVAHMLKNEHGYNGVLGAEGTLETWENFRGKRQHDRSLYTFGWGDGGGGPTFEMLEHAQRQKTFPGLPRVELGRVEDMFSTVPKDRLPKWVGEQYLEYHRGTYTSQAALKRLDRRLTTTLVEAEAAAALSWSLLGSEYPAKALYVHWTTLLRNQFHDILPGSSIRTVNEETTSELSAALEDAELIKSEHLNTLASRVAVAGERGLVLFNLGAADRPLNARLPRPIEGDFRLVAPDGTEVPWQEDGEGIFVSAPCSVPSLGYLALSVEGGPPSSPPDRIRAAADLLENEHLRVTIAEDGTIHSVFDKQEGREVLADRGNQIWAHTDIPREYDAWDVDASYQAEGREIRAAEPPSLVAAGPVVGAVRVRRRHGDAVISQTYRLATGSRRLEIETEIDWTGRRTVLRARFPLAVRAHEAWFETAFGAVPRPTHRNTPWDAAKFEVPAHRFMDVSEGGYGVALINDGKYGHSIEGGTVGLTLLRSPIYPDPYADEGHHRFTYALHPHAGDWRETTVGEAHDLDSPLAAVVVAPKRGGWPPARSFLSVSTPALRLAALKKCEDQGALLLRLYESHGSRGVAKISSELPVDAWSETDLLEQSGAALDPPGQLSFRPFQVISLRAAPKP